MPQQENARPAFIPFRGACPVCGEEREDLVDYGQGVGESPPRLGRPVEYHWFIVYGPHYGRGKGDLCPWGLHPAHCAGRRCDRHVERVVESG